MAMSSSTRSEATAGDRFAALAGARPRQARGRAAGVCAALGLILALAGCASARPATDGVALLPDLAASGHVWHWTGQCPFGPAAGSHCAAAGPVLRSAQLTGDGWNLGSAGSTGSLAMSVDSQGSVTMAGSFARTAPCLAPTCLAPSAYTWVRAFPSVLYGVNQCHAGTSPPASARLPFPMRLSAIPSRLIGVTAYSARTSQVTYDVAYDLWLHDSSTRQPCRSEGTLEIMVWTDYDQRALLPASMQIGTASIPFAVDGVPRPDASAWSVYASNIDTAGRTAPWGGTLWFVPDHAGVVSHGRVSVDLSSVLSAAGDLLHADYGWPELGRRYWLDTAAFGVEFGPASGGPVDAGPTRFSAQISAYCLDPGSTLDRAPC